MKVNENLFRVINALVLIVIFVTLFISCFLGLLAKFVILLNQILLTEDTWVILATDKKYSVTYKSYDQNLLNKQKVSEEDLLTCLCLNNFSIQKGKIFFHF